MWYGPFVALVDGALGKSLRESLKRREGEERRRDIRVTFVTY